MSRKADEIDIETLRKLLTYDFETGALMWKRREPDMFKPKTPWFLIEAWNQENAGKPAFTAKLRNGYHYGGIKKRSYLAHRVCFALHYGYWPDQVDHIDGCRSNNRSSNLRESDATKNHRNMALSKRNTSGIVGVRKSWNRWQAIIGNGGPGKFLRMSFDTKEEAIAQRLAWEISLGYSGEHGKRPTDYFQR